MKAPAAYALASKQQIIKKTHLCSKNAFYPKRSCGVRTGAKKKKQITIECLLEGGGGWAVPTSNGTNKTKKTYAQFPVTSMCSE